MHIMPLYLLALLVLLVLPRWTGPISRSPVAERAPASEDDADASNQPGQKLTEDQQKRIMDQIRQHRRADMFFEHFQSPDLNHPEVRRVLKLMLGLNVEHVIEADRLKKQLAQKPNGRSPEDILTDSILNAVKQEDSRARYGWPVETLKTYTAKHIERLRDELKDLNAKVKTRARPCCEEQDQAIAKEKSELLERAEKALATLEAKPQLFDNRLGQEDLFAFSNFLDGLDYLQMDREGRVQFLKAIYLPSLKNANMTNEQIAEALANGKYEVQVTKGGAGVSREHPSIDPKAPWLHPNVKCRSGGTADQRDSFGGFGAFDDFDDFDDKNDSGAQHRSESTESFLNYFGVKRSPAKQMSEFDKRLNSTRTPRLQGPTDACVGFAMAEDLNHEMDRQGLFAELAPSFDGLQLYNQLRSATPQTCVVQSDTELFHSAKENAGGLNIPSAMNQILRTPPCLYGSQSKVKVGKSKSLNLPKPERQIDFNFFQSLIDAGRGAMLWISTELGVEQEDWLQYGCKSKNHAIYLSGVGRGKNPFNNKVENYVVVRDSFRSTTREYKVPLRNLLKVLTGVSKASDLSVAKAEAGSRVPLTRPPSIGR